MLTLFIKKIVNQIYRRFDLKKRCIGRNRNLRRCNRSVEGHLFCYDHRYQPIVWISFFIFTVIAGFASIYSVLPINKKVSKEFTDVTIRFIYPKFPSLILVNNSDVIAYNIKWSVAIWNMGLPDRYDPLPIPIRTFDWIKPHGEGGPLNLFNTKLVSPLLKKGDQLFGSMVIDCPECKKGRTYVVSIIWGESGWYAKFDNGGSLIIPSELTKEGRLNYFNKLRVAVPDQVRIPIGER